MRYCLCLVLLFQLKLILAQTTPANPCADKFQYITNNRGYIGKITLMDVPFGQLSTEVVFSQNSPLQTPYIGSLQFEHNLDTVQTNMENNWPITYRVEFPDPYLPPRLTSIVLNGMEVCRGSSDAGSGTAFRLHRNFYPTEGSRRLPRPPPQFDHRPIKSEQSTITMSFQSPTLPFQQQSQSQLPPSYLAPLPTPHQESTTINTDTTQSVSSICGLESSIQLPLIVFGSVIERGQCPWLTAIYVKQPGALSFICGGSLVSTSTVITAAHCFMLHNWSKDQIVAYLGRNNLDRFGESGTEARDVETLLIHPDFNKKTFSDADIALLQLKPVSFTQYIRPICLWSEPIESSLIVGETGYVAGWGADEYGRNVSARPKMVDSKIISESECLRSSEVFKVITSERTLCAGNRDGTGPCSGDSGGGFVLQRNERWTLRALVSTGQLSKARNCDLMQYVVYTDIAKHLDWVRSKMWP